MLCCFACFCDAFLAREGKEALVGVLWFVLNSGLCFHDDDSLSRRFFCCPLCFSLEERHQGGGGGGGGGGECVRSARFVCVCVCVCLSRLEKRSSWCDQVQVWVSEKCRASNESKINREREPHSVAWRLRQARLCLLSCGVEREVRGTMEAQMTKEGGGRKSCAFQTRQAKARRAQVCMHAKSPSPSSTTHTHTHTLKLLATAQCSACV